MGTNTPASLSKSAIVSTYQSVHRNGVANPAGVRDAEVRVEAICPQKRSNPSVPVRKAPRAFVGQVFTLRPVSNRPPASVRQCRKGGLQARRRLETCPTKHRRIHFHVAPILRQLLQDGNPASRSS